MTKAQFRNALCILSSIDMDELVDAGVIPSDDTVTWQAFRADPFRWFVRSSDANAARIWAIIQSRQPKDMQL